MNQSNIDNSGTNSAQEAKAFIAVNFVFDEKNECLEGKSMGQ